MKFEKIAEQKFENLHLKVSGFLNESADLGKYDFGKINTLSIDFAGFELINSRGIMIWIRWFHEARLANKELRIIFSNCPEPLVSQFNIIKTLLPKDTIVKSFFIPMACPDCAHSAQVTLYSGDNFKFDSKKGSVDVVVPKTLCSKCGAALRPEISPDKYFQFLKVSR